MDQVTFEFWLIGAAAGTSGEEALVAHRERVSLLHAMQKAIGIEVIDWGRTDQEQPSEIVEIVVILVPVVVPAFASLVKLWLDSRRLEKVRIVRTDGTRIEVESGTPEQIASVIKSASQHSESVS